jgi:DNA recombination protein RmuC
MLALIVGAVAAIAGILVGFWLRGAAAKGELNGAKTELADLKVKSEARAGFEVLAEEREKTIIRISAEAEKVRAEFKAKSEEANRSTALVAELNAKLESEQKNLAEKLQLLESAKQTLANQFQALAADILDKKSKSFAEGSQKELSTLLDPLKVQLRDFREKVEKAQIDSTTGVTKLETLIGALNGLNQQLSEEARNLTTALRGSAKAQGDWGEFILRDLLEKAGLREGEQFSFQQSFAVEAENGDRARTARTDVILRLPGERCLVIDSKVSLNAYTDFANAATDSERSAALKQHLASVRGHVVGLGKAGYHRLPGLETPDFVVMFVPIEPAFLIALQNDGELWADAYRQNILLVGPTTLLYIIRIVNVLWQQETQARNVKEVMDRGAKLYEKFAGFVNDMEEIGKSLRSASSCYEDARNKLSMGPGNLIKQVEMLRQLGVKPRKTLSPKLLELADVEEPGLALAAEADENGSR